jgi:hypothetical protein
MPEVECSKIDQKLKVQKLNFVADQKVGRALAASMFKS